MAKSEAMSMQGRRDRTGGIVRDKLDLLMAELEREKAPTRLVELAKDLQAAMDDKMAACDKRD
ncbi:hypothetical protein J2045_001598 [Peteryoungia aggregata LMG 23059]|uniref:Uncharacterized protein n=1 Tax=Peteryoungia aggregata LMG 23059 TaxID=1368425 RepID=A0ABU0G5F0_9HYPH|nr:hypothetical protein [Peteryoungia aggregata]MDQ0420574.1 hypothetical protein [Peteryoungia aggregata LMG 23059]